MNDSNRVYKRKKYSVPFTFTAEDYPPVASPLHAMPGSAIGLVKKENHGGRIKNTSLDGFCFETGKALPPGTEIEAKMVNFNPIQLGDTRFDDCQATVKWCHRSDEREDCYEIGVQRKRADDLPIINFKDHHFASVKCF